MIPSIASNLRKPSFLQETGKYPTVFTTSYLMTFSSFSKNITLQGAFMKANICGREITFSEIL